MRSHSSYELTSDTQVTKGAGSLCSCLVITDGTNDATVILYDVAAAASVDPTNKLFEWKVTGANNVGGRNWVHPVNFANGLYLDITGDGASCIIEHTR
jgi:hypothetical protein